MPQSDGSNDLEVLLLAIQTAGSVNNSLTDIEFSAACHISREDALEKLSAPGLEQLLRRTRVTSVRCDECARVIKVAENGQAFCGSCTKWLPEDAVPRARFSFLTEQLQSYLTQYVVDRISLHGLVLAEVQGPYRRLARSDGMTVDVYVRAGQLGLEDYYTLRGWRPNPFGLRLLIGDAITRELETYSTREPDCLVSGFPGLEGLKAGAAVESGIDSRLDTLHSASAAAGAAGVQPRDDTFASERPSRVRQIIESLPRWATQSGTEALRVQEDEFEVGVLTILNLTLFRAKHLGGRDQPDGYVQLVGTGRNLTWIPIETKTFQAADGEVYSVAGCRVQLAKYAQAWTSANVRTYVDVPAFLVVAKDFNLDHPQEREVVESLERDSGIRYQFMPVKSLLYLLERWAVANLIDVDDGIVREFFTSVRYVTPSDVDQLLEQLRKSAKLDESILRELRREVHTRKGK